MSAVVTFFTDLLEPLGPYLSYTFIACLALALICWRVLTVEAKRDRLPADGSEAEGAVDWAISGLLLTSLGAALSGLALLGRVAVGDPERGLVAEWVPSVRAVQRRFGVVEEKLDAAVERLDETGAKLDNVKRETSEDPARN